MKKQKLNFKKETIAKVDSLNDVRGGVTYNYNRRSMSDFIECITGSCPDPTDDCPTMPVTVCRRCHVDNP